MTNNRCINVAKINYNTLCSKTNFNNVFYIMHKLTIKKHIKPLEIILKMLHNNLQSIIESIRQ